MTSVPPEVLGALGRLNAHARGSGAPWNPRSAIYAYKTVVTLVLIEQGEVSARFVRLTVPCTCGDGWWRGWHADDEKRRCYICSGSAKRVLRFTETTLPDGQVWHHPWEGRDQSGYEIGHACVGRWQDLWTDAIEWEHPGDWCPRAPAVTLTLDDLAGMLNVVEDWVEGASIQPTPGASCRWAAARRCLHQQRHRGVRGPNSHAYHLDLGGAPACIVCGDTAHASWRPGDATNRFGIITPMFHWTEWACSGHGPMEHPQIARRTAGDVDVDMVPPDALLTPAVRRWMERHSQVVEATW